MDIKDVCVLLAPLFAANTAMVAYMFGTELKDRSTGLVAAAFIAVVPGYISRSVAGSYDWEKGTTCLEFHLRKIAGHLLLSMINATACYWTGSYDNEAISIFAMMITFYFFVRAVNTGSMLWAISSALSYFYMVRVM